MPWSFEIELGNWAETIVNYEPVRTVTWTKVYANQKSLGQKEFYEGMNAGLKPELVFEVRAFEFNNYEKVRVDGTNIYDIIRTFTKGETTEIFLSAPIGGGI